MLVPLNPRLYRYQGHAKELAIREQRLHEMTVAHDKLNARLASEPQTEEASVTELKALVGSLEKHNQQLRKDLNRYRIEKNQKSDNTQRSEPSRYGMIHTMFAKQS